MYINNNNLVNNKIIKRDMFMEQKIKILLCEDQEFVSEGIANALNNEPNFEVVETLLDAQDIAPTLEKIKVDIVITDIITKNKHNVLDYIPQIKEKFPQVKIITITGFPDISFMEKAKKAGVNSFVYKNVGTKELVSLIQNTFFGYYVYPSEAITNDLIISSLSEVELKILRLYISGMEREEIAKELCFSISTIKAHISSIIQKTGFPSLARVAIYAVNNGLIVAD